MIIISQLLVDDEKFIDLINSSNCCFFYNLNNYIDLITYINETKTEIKYIIYTKDDIIIPAPNHLLFNNNFEEIKSKIANDLITNENNENIVENKNTHLLYENYLYIIGGTFRYGVLTFVTTLEQTILNEIDNNDDIPIDIFISNHGIYQYIVCGVPLKYKDLANDIAEKHELRLIPGRPISSEYGPFELNYSDLFVVTIENTGATFDLNKEELKLKLKEELEELKQIYLS